MSAATQPAPALRHPARRPRIERAGKAALSAAITEPPGPADLARVAGLAREVEVRADLAGELEPAALRAAFRGRLAYSLRSVEHGGRCDAGAGERRARLVAAARHYDVVELEHPHDLSPEVLSAVPAVKRRVYWRGPAASTVELERRLAGMADVPAGLYVLAPCAATAADALAPLRFLAGLGRSDVTAYATGDAGAWTRIIAPRLGAPLVSGGLTRPVEPGGMTVARLAADFGLPLIGRLLDLYGIVGATVERSLAPRIYNRGFRALGLPAICVPFASDDFAAFWRDVVGDGLPALGIAPRGLTVVTPHKEQALAAASLSTVRAREAGAANSLVRAGGSWHGATTTRLAGLLAEAGIDVAGRSAAVVGCGGAGRAVAIELHRHGARVTLVNRGDRRGAFASELLGLRWRPLAQFDPAGFDLLVNATPLCSEMPFDISATSAGAAIADLAYRPGAETALIAAARARGLRAVDGRVVLRAETAGQFELMTGQPMPPGTAEMAGAGDGAG